MKRCHRTAVAVLGLLLACSSGRATSGNPEARQAVIAAMDHYTSLIRAVASDSIAAMYTEDGGLDSCPREAVTSRCMEEED
jgi:hypothetical protein